MTQLLVDTGFLVALLTVDDQDFQVYRLANGHAFELVRWYDRH